MRPARLPFLVATLALAACAVGAQERPRLDPSSENEPALDGSPAIERDPELRDAELGDAASPLPPLPPLDGGAKADAGEVLDPGAADDCSPSQLAAARPIVVRPGSPALFSVELGTANTTWVSGCIGAFGPDRVQPLTPDKAGRLVVTVDSTRDVAGSVVLYAKSQCGAPSDLACGTSGRLEVAVSPNTPVYLHVDTVSSQASTARVTLFVELR